MAQFLIGAAILFILVNLYYFFTNKTYRKSYFSTALFLKLFLVLTGVLFGFTLIYYALSTQEVILVKTLTGMEPVDHSFWNLLYFSGVTLFSVGYGDMLPLGAARFFSLLESILGILLPAAYFMKALDQSNQGKKEE
ncbi:potassium channel family protein [Saliterribacillus persicus]|uniref:Potassium channel LctB n=1 Tax=Saliterribacillus persicus TaxID=930114 RepID=A0A368Y4M3_9BACI|nr:potassium channel family protein [Saliterribacillus persicus]RCW73174.1 potassium channel LctB [Saliterribacillus persicus]